MASLIFEKKKYVCGEGESVLEALERQGVNLPSSCRSGVCHSCLVKSVACDPPAEAQKGLKETWKRQKLFLACICRTSKDLEIALPDTDVGLCNGEVIEKKKLSPDIVLLRIKPFEKFDFKAGQFVNLIRHDGLTRSYSIASLSEEGYVELHIRKAPQGQMSTWLYEDAPLGEKLSLRGPNGDCFYVSESSEEPLLLIGTGTGLAPLYGVLRDALRSGHRGPIYLFHGGRDLKSLYLHEELFALEKSHPNFHYHPSALETGGDARVHAGRIDDYVQEKFPNLVGYKVYLCGDPKLVGKLKQNVYRAGARLEDIFADAFISSTPPKIKEGEGREPLKIIRRLSSSEFGKKWTQRLRFAFQALIFAGFVLQGLLYYKFHFRPLGNLLPFMAYDSLGHMVVSSALLAWGAIFLLVMLFGRFVCGWFCPLGFFQDAGEKLLRLLKVRLKRPVNQPRLARYVLAAIVLTQFVAMPLLASPVRLWQFDLHFREPWLLGFPFHLSLFLLDLFLVFLVIGIILPLFFGPRPYCKLVCETGLLLDNASKNAFGRIRRNHGFDRNTCLSCERCTNICPQGINVYQEVNLFDRVVNSNCITCLQCVNTCPNDTIIYSLRKQVKDTGKVAGYLASQNSKVEDLPRHLLTGIGAIIGGYIGLRVLSPSYFHTYLLFAACGGLMGWLLWRLFSSLLGERWGASRLKAATLSQAEREAQERVLPLTPLEKTQVAPSKPVKKWVALNALASLAVLTVLAVWIAHKIPPRIASLSELPPAKLNPATRAAENIVYFGIPPVLSSQELHGGYSKLAPYLHKKLHKDLRLVTAQSYGELAHALETSQIDAAILPPAAYYSLKERRGEGWGLLQIQTEGGATYDGILLTRTGGPSQVRDLRGTRGAFTSLDSVSGYLAPMALLKENHIEPIDLGEILLSGNHSTSLALLDSGRVDFAATYEGALKDYLRKKPESAFQKIAVIHDLPSDVLAVSPQLSKEISGRLKESIERIFTEQNSEGMKEALEGIGVTGVAPINEESFRRMGRWISQ